MKIVCVDNYDREFYDDILVCENIRNEKFGNIMVDALNSREGSNSEWFYKLVEDDYKLFKFEDII